MSESSSIGAPIGAQRNQRVSHIRKFVCVPPERGEVLRLVAVEDPPTVLGEWPKVACVDNGSTAEAVDSLLREHATTNGTETLANLTWQSAEGLVVCTKRLRCKPEGNGDDSSDPAALAQAEAAGLDGSRRADLIQLQKEREAFMRSYFSAHQTQNSQYIQLAREQRELITTLASCLREQYTATHAAHLALDKQHAQQRSALDDAAERIRDSVDATAEESGARAELIKMVGGALAQSLPFIVAQVGKMLTEAATTAPAAPAAAAAE